MKQKMKEHKGITLVALILTIIVLLILAVVAISAVKGDGIISHAKNARDLYATKSEEENALLQNYLEQLNKEINGGGSGNETGETENAWKQEKTKVTKGDETLEVGDTITNFTAGGKTWKVLGAENGKLLLTTTENVNDSFTLDGRDATIRVWDEATASYKNAEKALDDECKAKITLTETEQNQVAELRSIKVEDINRVTGYNPEKTGDGKVYAEGKVYQYGNEVTYSLVKDASGAVTGVKYDSKVKSGTSTDFTQFWLPNTSTDITSSYTVRGTSYYYYPDSLTDTKLKTGEECKGIAKDSAAYILLFRNPGNTSNVNYWLASSFVYANEGDAYFGLHIVDYGRVYDDGYLWSSIIGGNSNSYGVRPVVSLKSDFQPIK